MGYLSEAAIQELKGKLSQDFSILGKIYKTKKSDFIIRSVDFSLVDNLKKEGWEEFGSNLKTKARLRKQKSHSKKFEDDLWCQFYELGYRHLNYDENFYLPFSKQDIDRKQIDVVAINDETVFLIECRSSEKLQKAPSYRDEFEALPIRLAGFRKVVEQAFGKGLRIKYIFATRNLRIDPEGPDIERLKKTKSFYYNDNTYSYINSLIKNYKNAALYQILGIIFKNELINTERIEIPCIRGTMGNRSYYMFSIEPTYLLKMSFILHRTKAHESEMPTYQRLLIPSRLKGITKYIDQGGYFPNSIIVNFNTKKRRIEFTPASKGKDSTSTLGILKLPNAYAYAYVIDGQHRLYGYASSHFRDSNTIPVVAFQNLTSVEQLEIFMDINQNQKAVKPSLRLTLEDDLYWDSDRADLRLKALRSSIVKQLGNSSKSALFNRIEIGEDPAPLKLKPFISALTKSTLLPTAKGNKYSDLDIEFSLYNTQNHNHDKEMQFCRKKVVQLISDCYDYVEENYPEIYEKERYFILSNRGTYAFICLIGSLNKYLIKRGDITNRSDSRERFECIRKYLEMLLKGIENLSKEEESKQLTILGSRADIKWLRFFQMIVHESEKSYEPDELIDWKERQDEELQDQGRKFGVAIEKYMKKQVLTKIKQLYGDDWDLEINSIKRECQKRAEEENEKNYKEGLEKKKVLWTEMFNITDYKTIISKYWTKKPEQNEDFVTFEEQFTIDIGEGINSKAQRLKWISFFNSYRNLWAHEGTKEKRLNREEVSFLGKIHEHFYNSK